MSKQSELDENNWQETEYICKECGGEDVVSNITNDWKTPKAVCHTIENKEGE